MIEQVQSHVPGDRVQVDESVHDVNVPGQLAHRSTSPLDQLPVQKVGRVRIVPPGGFRRNRGLLVNLVGQFGNALLLSQRHLQRTQLVGHPGLIVHPEQVAFVQLTRESAPTLILHQGDRIGPGLVGDFPIELLETGPIPVVPVKVRGQEEKVKVLTQQLRRHVGDVPLDVLVAGELRRVGTCLGGAH